MTRALTEMEIRVARALARKVIEAELRSGDVHSAAPGESDFDLALAAVVAEDNLWPKFIEEARVAIRAIMPMVRDNMLRKVFEASGMTPDHFHTELGAAERAVEQWFGVDAASPPEEA